MTERKNHQESREGREVTRNTGRIISRKKWDISSLHPWRVVEASAQGKAAGDELTVPEKGQPKTSTFSLQSLGLCGEISTGSPQNTTPTQWLVSA